MTASIVRQVIGIFLQLLGGFSLCTVFLSDSQREAKSDDVEKQRLIDAVIPALALFVAGIIVLIIPSRDSTLVAATPDRWMWIPVSDRAVNAIRRAIVERQYPSDTAVRICKGATDGELEAKYDYTSIDEDDFVSEDKGIRVFVERALVSQVHGLQIDAIGDQLVIEPLQSQPSR